MCPQEQIIAKILWRIDKEVHEFFELTHGHRTKDPWLSALLKSYRYGNESWESYCFTHGLPTRHPGSWLPEKGGPTCGSAHCQTWAARWQVARDNHEVISWDMRLNDECKVCAAERKRRNRIITTSRENTSAYKEEPFTDAPFVHPFRAPSYHAQHLRSIAFARQHNQRLLWITAHDQLLTNDAPRKPGSIENRREHWLEYHERFTNGIPGLFPCVLNLPVRFTDSPDVEAKQQGIFKYTRGKLCGWLLDPTEEARVAALGDVAEIVLIKRPLRLLIEVPSANDKLPLTHGFKIYSLKLSVKQWCLDAGNKVRVRRFGFPLVPDFGGTAHAYCGDTVPAVLGDLMKWNHIPTLDNALRAYIIMSRVRDISNILLAQPYSPGLFRQGVQPGPHLLRQILLGELTPQEAKKSRRLSYLFFSLF